jgi:hypothetical protein
MLLGAELGCQSYGTSDGRMRTRLWLMVSGLLAFTKILGMDPKEAEQICRDAVTATRNKNLHAYSPQ